jgi:hypothetical protein
MGLFAFLTAFSVCAVYNYYRFIIPMREHPDLRGDAAFLFACQAFDLFVVAFMAQYVGVIWSDPGVKAKAGAGGQGCIDDIAKHLAGEPVDLKQIGNVHDIDMSRVCYTCWIYRGPRTKHCPVVGSCVEAFDHDCTFIDQVVGFKNHPRFLLTLITEISMQFCYIYIALRSFSKMTSWAAVFTCLCGLFNTLVMCGLLFLLHSQTQGVLLNMTTYEMMNAGRMKHFWPKHGPGTFVNTFDHGSKFANCVAFWRGTKHLQPIEVQMPSQTMPSQPAYVCNRLAQVCRRVPVVGKVCARLLPKRQSAGSIRLEEEEEVQLGIKEV